MSGKIALLNNKKMLYSSEEHEVFYKKGALYFKAGPKSTKAVLSLSLTKRIMTRSRMAERVFRLEPKAVVQNEDAFYFSCHGAIYKYFWNTGKISVVHKFRKSMNNPVCLKKLEGIRGFEEGVVYGEYWGNGLKEEVNIFQEKAGVWEAVYTFPRNTITHVHGFVFDSDRNRVLILTGDFDEGSGIWSATDNFKNVKPLLTGRQQYRCCVAFAGENGIVYATDTPLEQNAVYFLEEKNGVPGLTKIQELPGPCIYGKELTDENGEREYLLATSVEPDSRIVGMKYLLTNRLGQGVKDRRVHIFRGNERKGFSELLFLEKDRLPMGLFQFGNVQFPDCGTRGMVCTPQSVKKYDGKTIRILEQETL